MSDLVGTFIVEDSGTAELLEDNGVTVADGQLTADLVGQAKLPDLVVQRGERATVREVTKVSRLKGRGKKPR